MLELAGEHGYPGVTIAAVLARSRSNRAQFYAAFESKDACLEAAYADGLAHFLGRLFAACGDEVPWAHRMRGALETLVSFTVEEPAIARGLLSGARQAGDGVDRMRRGAIERLAEGVDAARLEIGSRPGPPPITARFLVGVVEAAVLQYLAEPDDRDFGAEIEDVLYMVIDTYLGPDAARAEARAFAPGTSSDRTPKNI